MFALNRLSLASGEKSYNPSHCARKSNPPVLRIQSFERPAAYVLEDVDDLREPLVRSEGSLDPVDGLAVSRLLQDSEGPDSAVLAEEIGDYEKVVSTKWEGYNGSDPLDLGMTLWTACWFAESDEWAWGLQEMARRDLTQLWEEGYFDRNTKKRLAFREFGTALGMRRGSDGDD